MSAQPIHHEDPTDPENILARLPEQVHPTFLRQYETAVRQAHAPAGYRGLVELLHVWSLRADAYAEPGYWERRQEARNAAAAGSRGMSPEELLAARRAR